MRRTIFAVGAALAMTVAVPLSAGAAPHGMGGGPPGGGAPHMSGGGAPHMSGGAPHMGGNWGGGFRDHGFRGRGFGPGFAFGFGGPYYDYDYYGYDDGGCYAVRRVPTPYGWRLRRVWVC